MSTMLRTPKVLSYYLQESFRFCDLCSSSALFLCSITCVFKSLFGAELHRVSRSGMKYQFKDVYGVMKYLWKAMVVANSEDVAVY